MLVDCFPDREVEGGAPFNVAHHLLGLDNGLRPVLVTRIGKDARGRHLLDTLKAAGLPTDGVQLDSLHPTGEVRVVMEPDGHHYEILPNQAWDFIHGELARLISLACRPQWLYFGSLAQRAGSSPALRTLTQARRGIRSFFDVNLRDPWVRKDVLRWSMLKAQVVKMNEEELPRVAHMLGQGSGPARLIGERLVRAFDLHQLLVTRGARGAWLLRHDGRHFETPEIASLTDVVDTVGAGDGFAAVFLLGLIRDWPPELILARAHRFAGDICRIRGAVPQSRDFYSPFVQAWQSDGMDHTLPEQVRPPPRQ